MSAAAVRVWRDVRLGVKNLMLHKLRSLLTMLGLVFGVGSVVAMLAIGEGASAAAIEQIRRLGSHNVILRAAKPAPTRTASPRRSPPSCARCPSSASRSAADSAPA